MLSWSDPAPSTAEPEHPPTIPAGARCSVLSDQSDQSDLSDLGKDTALDMAAVMRDRMNRCRTDSGLSRLLDIVDEIAADLGDQAPVIRDEIRNRQQALRPNTNQ